MTQTRLLDMIVFDEEESCPYLPDQSARMPLAIPRVALTPEQIDRRLELGQRRSGEYVYFTRCPRCRACEALRLKVERFRPNQTQRRIWNRGQRRLECQIGPIVVDESRVALFNRHRYLRGLDRGRTIDAGDYFWGFARTCFESFEMAYYDQGRLVAIAICDQGKKSLSAVYTYFDPDYGRLSPGVFSILNQIDYCRRNHLQYLYLGFYIAASPHMSYKAAYLPHQRLIDGSWVEFDRPAAH